MTQSLSFAALPAIGSALLGGAYKGVTTRPDGSPVAVVLLPASPADPVKWADAKAWAASVGGELPTRPVSALLEAIAPERFEHGELYWLADVLGGVDDDEDSAPSAWIHCAISGQSNGDKQFAASCMAVQLLPLSA